MSFLAMAWRYLKFRRLVTFLTVVGIALGVALVCAVLARISHRHLSIRRKWVLRAMVRHGWDEQGTTVKLRAGFRGIVDSKWPSFGGNRCD